MAQKITVALEYDLDGGPADQTVRFELDGTSYEIDLSNKNAALYLFREARQAALADLDCGAGVAGAIGGQRLH